MLTASLSRAADALAIACIRGYQEHLSPRKGFSCPHRLLHGGASCSEFVRRAVAAHGLRGSVPLVRERFGHCHQAAQVLARRHPQAMAAGSPSWCARSRRWLGRRAERLGCEACSEGSNCALDGLFDCGPADTGCIDCLPCGCPW